MPGSQKKPIFTTSTNTQDTQNSLPSNFHSIEIHISQHNTITLIVNKILYDIIQVERCYHNIIFWPSSENKPVLTSSTNTLDPVTPHPQLLCVPHTHLLPRPVIHMEAAVIVYNDDVVLLLHLSNMVYIQDQHVSGAGTCYHICLVCGIHHPPQPSTDCVDDNKLICAMMCTVFLVW